MLSVLLVGFDRLGAGAAAATGHLDPLWLAELQRHYIASGTPLHPAQIPGIYAPPPANVPPDIMHRERERIGKYQQSLHHCSSTSSSSNSSSTVVAHVKNTVYIPGNVCEFDKLYSQTL